MSHPLIPILDAEIASLREKLDSLVRTRRLYGRDEGELPEDERVDPSNQPRYNTALSSSLRTHGKVPQWVLASNLALEIVRAFRAEGVTGPIKTSDIYDRIKNRIAIGGHAPVSNLSAMIGKSNLLSSVGRQGWILPAEAEAQVEQDLSDTIDGGGLPIDVADLL